MLNSIFIVLLGAGLTFLATWFWWKKNAAVKEAERLAEQQRKLEDRVREMELQLRQVSSSIIPINAAFQAILIKELTHFHTPRMDELLEKLGPPITLTLEEEEELRVALLERSKDLDGRISEQERDAALMLPMVMKRVRLEATPLKIQTVAIVEKRVGNGGGLA